MRARPKQRDADHSSVRLLLAPAADLDRVSGKIEHLEHHEGRCEVGSIFERSRIGPQIADSLRIVLGGGLQYSFPPVETTDSNRYARAVVASKRARWDLYADVLRDRCFDRAQKFLPDGLSFAQKLSFLTLREIKA